MAALTFVVFFYLYIKITYHKRDWWLAVEKMTGVSAVHFASQAL